MSQIYNEPLLDKIISENTEKLERITEISKKYFEHFLILVNLSGSTKRHVILQQLPMDVTIVYVEQLSSISNTESSFITQVKELGDAIYLEELTRLERKAAYITPNLALLMDSKLFYASDKKLEKNYHQCKQDCGFKDGLYAGTIYTATLKVELDGNRLHITETGFGFIQNPHNLTPADFKHNFEGSISPDGTLLKGYWFDDSGNSDGYFDYFKFK